MHHKQKKVFEEHSATFNSDIVTRWEKSVQDWEANPEKSKDDPFDDERESEFDSRNLCVALPHLIDVIISCHIEFRPGTASQGGSRRDVRRHNLRA